MMGKIKVLVLIDWFRPGFKAGGPIQSVSNLVTSIQDEIEWYIMTSDSDFGSTEPYPGIVPEKWVDWEGKAQVWYFKKDSKTNPVIIEMIKKVKPDLVYFNSLFSLRYTLFPLRQIKKLENPPRILLAPRGMLHPGALAIKKIKKSIFLAVAKFAKLFEGVEFQATDALEASHIRTHFGENTPLEVVPNLPSPKQKPISFIPKIPGELKLIFLSRVSRKKNLHFLLDLLTNVDFHCELNIVGPVEGQDYFKFCKTIEAKISENVKILWAGSIPPEEVDIELRKSHLSVLPTLGENFGHSVFESFKAGRPMLLSDQTPWRNLHSQSIGWDLDLDKRESWELALRSAAAWKQSEFEMWAKQSFDFAKKYIEENKDQQKNLSLFLYGPKGF